jgi:hypothetical protein
VTGREAATRAPTRTSAPALTVAPRAEVQLGAIGLGVTVRARRIRACMKPRDKQRGAAPRGRKKGGDW